MIIFGFPLSSWTVGIGSSHSVFEWKGFWEYGQIECKIALENEECSGKSIARTVIRLLELSQSLTLANL